MASSAPPHPNGEENIVILGASYAGLSTAHYLLKHVVPKSSSPSTYRVVLVAPSTHTMCRPACPRAMISDDFFNQDRLFVSIQEQFTQYPTGTFRFIQAYATKLDLEHRNVTISTTDSDIVEVIDFSALVIATGASSSSPLLGFSSTEGHESLHNRWTELRKALPDAKNIVIAGGGPAGIETAGELGEYLNGRPGWLSSKPENPKVKITVVCASERILPALRPALAQKAETMLKSFGVMVLKSTRVVSVSPSDAGSSYPHLTTKAKITLHNGEVLEADVYIPATGTRPNTAFVPQEFLAPDGRIDTDPQTFRLASVKAGKRIYSIGDCSSAFRPAIHNILAAVPVLATNIKHDLRIAEGNSDEGEERLFKEDTRETQLVPIGKNKGVGAAMGWALPSWMVWLIKGRDYWLWTTGGLWSGKQWKNES